MWNCLITWLYTVVAEKKQKMRHWGWKTVPLLEGHKQYFGRWQTVQKSGQRSTEHNVLSVQSLLPLRMLSSHTPALKSLPREVTGGVLGQSHLPFFSQVPCWILKDCMMMKCALQITYRSMQFLILPHALDNSFKSQFIACYLTFKKLRGVSWTVKNPNQENSTKTQQTNQSFTQG